MEEHHTNSFQEDRYMTPHVKGILYISYILIIYEIYNFLYIFFLRVIKHLLKFPCYIIRISTEIRFVVRWIKHFKLGGIIGG